MPENTVGIKPGRVRFRILAFIFVSVVINYMDRSNLKEVFMHRKLWGIYIGQFAVNSTLWFFLCVLNAGYVNKLSNAW